MSYMETSLEKTIRGLLLLSSSLSVTLIWGCTQSTGLMAAKGPAPCEFVLSALEAVTLHTLTIWQQDLYFTYMFHLLKCIYSTFSLSALFFFCLDHWLFCICCVPVLSLQIVYLPFFRTQKYLISLCMGFTSRLFLFLSPFSVHFKFYSACLKH